MHPGASMRARWDRARRDGELTVRRHGAVIGRAYRQDRDAFPWRAAPAGQPELPRGYPNPEEAERALIDHAKREERCVTNRHTQS